MTRSRSRIGSIALFVLLGVLTGKPAQGDVAVPAIIGDNMVLQRNTSAAIWGWAGAGERVLVQGSWNGEPAETTADRRGRWLVRLPTPAAGGPYTLSIAGSTTVTLENVMIGEVWLCSGQSNMEMPVGDVGGGYRGVQNSEDEISSARFPSIRLFTVENTISAPRRANCRGSWKLCSPETVQEFSATAYFFGRELHDVLDVPIGLISADWGGTVAEAWMSDGALRPFPSFEPSLDLLELVQDPNRRVSIVQARVDAWWRGLDEERLAGWTTIGFDDSDWSSMILPVTLSQDGLDGFDGLVHFRKAFDRPEGWKGKGLQLELGPIDDYDDVWINGTPIGATHTPNSWAQPRRYEVPAAILGDSNVIAVRVLDTGGIGGINGRPEQLKIGPADGGPSIALAGDWSYSAGRSVTDLPPRPQGAEIGPNTPTVLFNGMIAPLIPFSLRGFIWYQGESNRSDPNLYRSLLPALIEDWRHHWDAPDLPFYFVQIAPFRYGGDSGQTAELREAQLMTLAVPHTGMAVTMDIGDRTDIHPHNKQEVGRRLALWAIAEDYGQGQLVHSGPLFSSAAEEGTSIRVRFDQVGSGLEIREGGARSFLIAGDDRRFVPATVAVDGNTLVFSSAEVDRPVAVRYGWEAAPEARLFNREGLPASPFRSDDWSGPLPPVENNEEMQGYRTDEPGFVPLSNGRNLEGWVNVNGAPSTWRVNGEVIECSGIPTGVLRTERRYENFILELEWRHRQPLGNAGVFVWSDPLPARGQPYTRGIEVQVLDGQEGDWYTSDGDIFPIHGATMSPENGRSGSRAFPTEARSNPAPLWNHYRIVAVDGTISLAVNGKVVTRGRECRPRKGYICLESEGSPVDFRNIVLKELPPSEAPLPPVETAEAAQPFELLYNGVDFSGWKYGADHEGHWRANDWRLEFDGQGPDLWTERSYRNFVLMADWRWTGPPQEIERPLVLPNGDPVTDADGEPITRVVADAGDSGIYLRGSRKSQVNIWCWPVGSGEVYGYRTDPKMPESVRTGCTPRTAADAPIGQWNRFIITMVGDRLTVELNGETVIERAQLPGVPESGPIGLQQHGSPIEFANLFIRELERE